MAAAIPFSAASMMLIMLYYFGSGCLCSDLIGMIYVMRRSKFNSIYLYKMLFDNIQSSCCNLCVHSPISLYQSLSSMEVDILGHMICTQIILNPYHMIQH